MAWSYFKFLSKSHAYVNEKVFSIIMIFIKIRKKTGSHNYPISVLKIVNMLSKKKSLGSNDVKKKSLSHYFNLCLIIKGMIFPRCLFFAKLLHHLTKLLESSTKNEDAAHRSISVIRIFGRYSGLIFKKKCHLWKYQ